jgi:hypothetical protein
MSSTEVNLAAMRLQIVGVVCAYFGALCCAASTRLERESCP